MRDVNLKNSSPSDFSDVILVKDGLSKLTSNMSSLKSLGNVLTLSHLYPFTSARMFFNKCIKVVEAIMNSP